ncbi:MAG: SDR family NAD(P)-dependent oxidoreductase [Salinibacterium sp.]|nr:SDR family NAD(P)-dependent oxidoreductase [Salinibacterium sp.]
MSSRAASVALITGASVGIGAEFARQLAGRGHELVLVARDAARLESLALELRDRYGVTVEVLAADLLEPSALARVEARVAASDRPVEVLVNNAGFGLHTDFDLNPIDDEVRLLELLVTVPARLAHGALRQMVGRRSGTIINVSSIAAYAPLTTYSAAKAWLHSFSRWANAYYRPAGITVTALAPGFVRTEFHARMSVTRESMAPGWMWLDVEPLVRTALRDADRGRAVSIPSIKYKFIAVVAQVLPMGFITQSARRGRWAKPS